VFSGRDVISILYFGLVVLGIAYFLGEGDVVTFFSTIKEIFPISENWEAIRQLMLNAWNEGSLGTTKNGESFEAIVLEYFPRSLLVIITAFFLAVTFGIAKGIFDYRNRYTYLNMLGTGITSFLSSLPDFFMILVLQWFMMIHLHFIDVLGYEQWHNFILPGILVSLYPMMYFARMTFTALANEDGEMYIQYARAKGLTEKMVVFKHIMKKCVHTILQYLGVVMTYVVSNLLIVEWLMDYKGAAWRMMVAIKRMNEFPEVGLIIEFSFCFMVLLFITQIVSVTLQNKYAVEKRNMWVQITKVVFQYLFIWFFILFIMSYLNPM